MKNAFSRAGQSCVSKVVSVVAGGLFIAGAMFAAPVNAITMNLGRAVTVGAVTLPAGQYVMTSYETGGDDFFVVRGEKTATVTLRAVRTEDGADKTAVTLSKDGNTWHFDKLTVAGEGAAFEFVNAK